MSQSTGLLILGLIAAALVCAAIYAVFARPSSGATKKRRKQIVDGFRLAGGILLGIFLMTCLVYGAHLATFGDSRRVSRPIAVMIAVVAFGCIALTVQRWAKYFAGFVVWGVYNAILAAISGHELNNRSIPVSRWYALGIGAVYMFSVLPTARFTPRYKLHAIEKLALLIWILAFTAAVLFPKADIASISAGDAALVAAWWWHRLHTDRHRTPELNHKPTLPTVG